MKDLTKTKRLNVRLLYRSKIIVATLPRHVTVILNFKFGGENSLAMSGQSFKLQLPPPVSFQRKRVKCLTSATKEDSRTCISPERPVADNEPEARDAGTAFNHRSRYNRALGLEIERDLNAYG